MDLDGKIYRRIALFSRGPVKASWKNGWDLLDEIEELVLSVTRGVIRGGTQPGICHSKCLRNFHPISILVVMMMIDDDDIYIMMKYLFRFLPFLDTKKKQKRYRHTDTSSLYIYHHHHYHHIHQLIYFSRYTLAVQLIQRGKKEKYWNFTIFGLQIHV